MRRITGAIAVLLILGLAAVGFSSAQKKTIDFIFGNGRFRFYLPHRPQKPQQQRCGARQIMNTSNAALMVQPYILQS